MQSGWSCLTVLPCSLGSGHLARLSAEGRWEGAVAFAAGTVGNGAGLGLVQTLTPVSLHVPFLLVPCARFPSQSGLC